MIFPTVTDPVVYRTQVCPHTVDSKSGNTLTVRTVAGGGLWYLFNGGFGGGPRVIHHLEVQENSVCFFGFVYSVIF